MNCVMKYLDFKDFINLMRSVTNEIILHIDPNGFSAISVDSTNVCLFEINLPKESFESYDCIDTFEIGLDLEEFVPFMNLTYGFVEIKITDDFIKLSSRKFKYSRTTLDIKNIKKEPNVPKIDFTSTVVVESIRMREFLKNARKIDEILVVAVEPGESTSFEVIGSENSCLSYTVDNGSKPCVSRYNIDYLYPIFGKLKGSVTLKFTDDHPIQIIGTFANYGVIKYLLAPRIIS